MDEINVEVDESVFGLTEPLVLEEKPFEAWRDFPIHQPEKCLGHWEIDMGHANIVVVSVQKDPFYGEEIRFIVYLVRYYISVEIHDKLKPLFPDNNPKGKIEGMKPDKVRDFMSSVLTILKTAKK